MFNSQTFRRLTSFRQFLRQHGGISKGLRESSSKVSINPPEIPSHAKYLIFTLNPKKFAKKKQQPLFIRNITRFTPHVTLDKPSTSLPRPLYYQRIIQTNLPYPGTHAFLYYYSPPNKPRIAGELRLRVVSSDSPTSFASGSDLYLPNGRPWSRSLCDLPKFYTRLYEKLREELLVPDDLDVVLSTLPFAAPRGCQLLHSLNDTFIVDFGSYSTILSVITEQALGKVRLGNAFVDKRAICGIQPYTGSALARFEGSTFPEHKGTRTIVLRFLKMITPIKCVIPGYDGHITPPKEGELYQKYSRSSNLDFKLWHVNIDRPRKNNRNSPSFQILWDA